MITTYCYSLGDSNVIAPKARKFLKGGRRGGSKGVTFQVGRFHRCNFPTIFQLSYGINVLLSHFCILQLFFDHNYGVQNKIFDTVVFTISVLNTIEPEFIPEEYALHPAYPNPFNPVTTISYDLPNDDRVSITIYDMMGREVRALVSASQTAGRKSIRWDGTNNAARQVAAGIYLCVIQTPQYVKTNKLILLK